eukprot:Gb_14194 [translate_table: standard]
MPRHILFFLLPFIIASFLLPCILCSDPFYQYCKNHTSTKCGYITLEYPLVFAGIDYVYDYGCGSPYSSHFHCVNGKQPSFTINHSNYTILNVSDDRRTCTIASEKVRNKNCDPSDYSYLRESSPDIHIASEYEMNITLLPCDNPLLNESNFFFGKLNCNSTWYYSFNNTSLPPPSLSCGPRVEVPVKVGSTFEEIPPNFLEEGFQIQWQENESFSQSCEFCEKSGGYCGYNVLNLEFVCSCQDTIHAKDCGDGGGSKSQPTGAIIGASLGGAVLVAAVVGIIVYRKRRRHPPGRSLIASDVSYDQIKNIEAGVQGKSGTLQIFSYEQLKQATDDFHKEKELGDGGFGSVYLGKLLDGRTVAVKRLYQDNSRRVQQFNNEVQILSSLHHPNLVRLFGWAFWRKSGELLLVYEYVPNGTLADHLQGERRGSGLAWDTRLKIASETAQALAFLHSAEPPILHRDVKSTNILLDENFKVKVADFGLSRLVPVDVTHVSTDPQGTPGYLDPEYHQSFHLTEKSDVYSFGVVLMEIISGKLAVDITRKRREVSLAYMAIAKIQEGALHELEDPKLDIQSNTQLKAMVAAVAELAFRCLAAKKDHRPFMKEVAAELERIGKMTDVTPEKFQSSQGITEL